MTVILGLVKDEHCMPSADSGAALLLDQCCFINEDDEGCSYVSEGQRCSAAVHRKHHPDSYLRTQVCLQLWSLLIIGISGDFAIDTETQRDDGPNHGQYPLDFHLAAIEASRASPARRQSSTSRLGEVELMS